MYITMQRLRTPLCPLNSEYYNQEIHAALKLV